VAETTRRLEDSSSTAKHPETFRRRHVSLLEQHSEHRKQVAENKNDKEKTQTCDKSLLLCLPDDVCAGCFRYLYNNDIDWGTVTRKL
jgi:hypothetical protein